MSRLRKSTPVNWDVAAAVAMGILVQGLVIDLERYPAEKADGRVGQWRKETPRACSESASASPTMRLP